MNKGLFEKVREFVKKIDPSSWPAFLMFAVVLAAAGGLNYVSMEPIVGGFLAVSVALFFGFGVLSWHIVESRTDDSKYQEDVAQLAKWLNVILDGALLVINLFRAQLHTEVITGLTGYDTAAYLIIGLSAASHVIGFLLWTQNDPRRIIRKELERSQSDVETRAKRANVAIQRTETEMKKRKWIADEAARLRAEYAGVPDVDVEQMVQDMTAEALRNFEGIKPQDVQPTQANKPTRRNNQMVYAANTPRTDPTEPPRKQ